MTRTSDLTRLAVGPVVFLAGLAVIAVSDALVVVGPFDRAEIGWALGVPLLAVAPALAALAERTPQLVGFSRRMAAVTSIAIGLIGLVAIATSVTFANCRPVASPLEILPQAVVAGALAAATFAGAYWVSARLSARQPVLAILAGATTWLLIAGAALLVVFVAFFPPLSCAAPG